jgi:type IV pilus assembly protein PilF
MIAVRHSSVVLLLALILSACSGAPKLDPTVGVDSPAQINAKLGLSYMQHGNYEVAEAKLKRALQQEPKLGEAHHYLAELYRRTDRPDLAKPQYRTALKYSPEDMSLHNNFGVYLCDQGDYAEAVKELAMVAASRNYNRPDEAYANAGLCALRIPDEVQAEKYLRSALAMNSRLPNALYQMAELSYKQQNYMKARAFMQRYAAVASQSPQSLLLGVRLELALGDRQAVDGYAMRLSTEFPDAEETLELERLLHPNEQH